MLLEKVVDEVDVVVFAFDGEGRLRLVNRAGEQLLGGGGADLIGLTAAELGLDAVRDQPAGTIVAYAGGRGTAGSRQRWRTTGPGSRTDNLWVPFFSTKPGGTGIGLALSREIVENHGGNISLENRPGAKGCIARISLPLS